LQPARAPAVVEGAAGLTPHVTAKLLGHQQVDLVFHRYADALPDEVARAGEVLAPGGRPASISPQIAPDRLRKPLLASA
jgi:hypothetical protein